MIIATHHHSFTLGFSVTIPILKRPEWLGISDISKVCKNTSQMGNLFSNVSVAYSYHHQGIMTKEHSCIYKGDGDSK